MADYDGLPPEERLPAEDPPPAPEVCPPPEEGASGVGPGERKRGGAVWRERSALLLALAGAALCGVISASPVKPEPAVICTPAPTVAATPAATPAPTPAPTPEPTEEPELPVLTDAERLTDVGTWKNTAENEWVHFNADGTGWWFDGTWFGLMAWTEDEEGGVSYQAAMAFLGPERKYSYDWAPEKEGDAINRVTGEGDIALEAEEDRFACPGLRFGEGVFLPDDTPIDDSYVTQVCGKTAEEFSSGTVWHMAETSDLGIPLIPGGNEEKKVYTDLVYVESLDFSAGVYRLTTRDDGLLQLTVEDADGSIFDTGEPVKVLEVPFTLYNGEETVYCALKLTVDIWYTYRYDYRPGDTEYNNLNLGWGTRWESAESHVPVFLLITETGLRLGMESVDWYPHNYTLLAP